MAPRIAAPGTVSAELGNHLLGIRERALEIGRQQDFVEAMLSVLVHILREGYDDDLALIDAQIDNIAADLKDTARQAVQLQAAIDLPTQGNA